MLRKSIEWAVVFIAALMIFGMSIETVIGFTIGVAAYETAIALWLKTF